MVAAGEVCPQRGWWACGDGNDKVRVLGGSDNTCTKAKRCHKRCCWLPKPAVAPQTVWESLRGLQSSYENKNPTLWELEDKRLRQRTTMTAPLAQPDVPNPGQGGPVTRTEVGVVVKTGTLCPANGWWRCLDANELDGARWFSSDALLPPAALKVQGAKVKAASDAAISKRRTEWRLARVDEYQARKKTETSNCDYCTNLIANRPFANRADHKARADYRFGHNAFPCARSLNRKSWCLL